MVQLFDTMAGNRNYTKPVPGNDVHITILARENRT